MNAHRAPADDKFSDQVLADNLGVGQRVDNGRDVDLLPRPYVRVVKREEMQKDKECLYHEKLRRENVVKKN